VSADCVLMEFASIACGVVLFISSLLRSVLFLHPMSPFVSDNFAVTG
jgi:hypothetical protein